MVKLFDDTLIVSELVLRLKLIVDQLRIYQFNTVSDNSQEDTYIVTPTTSNEVVNLEITPQDSSSIQSNEVVTQPSVANTEHHTSQHESIVHGNSSSTNATVRRSTR